jgi:hypothetical protein
MNITVTDAFGIASAVLLSLGGGGAVVVGLSSWLGKVWANRLMQKDIAKHSKELEELKTKFEAVNKRLQAELDKTLHVHHVQFEAEFKALYDIWAKLSAVRSSLAVSSPRFSETETKGERLKRLNDMTGQFTDAVVALKHAVHDQAPFYPKMIYEKLYEVIMILGEEETSLQQDAGSETRLTLWLDVNASHTLEKVADLADQISELIRQRIENLSLYRE